MKNFLAIDLGASSGRHILGRIEGGRLLLREIYRFPNSPEEGKNGLVWNTERLFGEILNGMKRAKELGCPPESIGIDTWGVDYVLLDKDDGKLGDAFCYRSRRTSSVTERVHERIPFPELYARTGIQFEPFNTVYQLAADRESGKLSGAARMLMLPDYFHFLLTGKRTREYTNATTTGLISAKTGTWDREILRELSLPEHLFPELSPAGTRVGTLSPAVRREVGFDAEVVLPATHDTASAVAACPREGAPYLSSGTWSLLGIVQNRAHTGAESRKYNFTNEGAPGGVFRFQKNIMGLWIIQQLRRERGKELSFARIAEMARKEKNGLLFDVDDARFFSPPDMGAEVERAVGRPLSLGAAAYCVYSSLAKKYAETVKELSSVTGEKYGELCVFGGGCKNALLNELTARAAGMKIIVGPDEATAVGNLLVQAEAAGETSPSDRRRIVEASFEIGEII